MRSTARAVVAVATVGTTLVATAIATAIAPAGDPAAAAPRAGSPTAAVTWLCRPGQTGDPCLYPETAKSVTADGTKSVVPAAPATDPAFDCFYVYPTVTASAATGNTGTAVTAVEKAVAVGQASRFSQVCRVWAPTYRQRTSGSLAQGLGEDPAANRISYESVLAAWKTYLGRYNDGRPVVLIGHSQGAVDLIRLLQSQVDGSAALRRRLVSAILLGGNVQVPVGKKVGGTFHRIPACTNDTETGCVIAYSSFATTPPKASLFGRPGQGVSLQGGQTARRGQQVLCTNPAALGSAGPAPLTPYFVVDGKWVTYPGLYTATCEDRGGASWLQVTSEQGDPRPVVKDTLGPDWGLHEYDVNLALGNLVDDVQAEEAAYEARYEKGAHGGTG